MKEFKYKQFVITASPISYQFDLWEEVEYQKIGTGTKENPNGELATRRTSHGYDMTVPRCIEKIVTLEVMKEESVDELKQISSQFQKVLDSIQQEFSKVKQN